MKLDSSELKKVHIVINSVDDDIADCIMADCDIVTRVPTLFQSCMIEWKELFKAIPCDITKPHARIAFCFLKNCALEGHPNNCCFMEMKKE